ncbi:UNVERIFIED_CONTAM: restriction endonuclease subunit S [Streptococcus canis]|uniref:Type I restriction-modification system S protein n=1 Tax=Streptococcus canis FSL Z3-227 TaxID=482234 RepID=A0AAV3FPT7_STRCB|nr:restriction endonuclease subunit S [Streptococcus canis]EIQ81120.1 type I restriction-modification system S protein [Streptococcus canis FSL Z3-227]MDV5993332.1 restriction endonuclease subunit S [Streptococcus canis]MDV6000439.1 restriction endonuclease subunit S [Streptococcus canis]
MTYIDEMIKELCPDGVEWKELGKVCVVKTGQSVNKTFIQNNSGDYPVINSGKEPLGYVDVFNTEDDPIGITSRGAGVGYVSWNEGKYFRGNLNYSATVKDSEKLLPRYLYYFLKNNSKKIEELCTFDGIPALNKSKLENLNIAIPHEDIQKEIVKILDKFTDYVTELTAELTAELTFRQKQYSYFRDKLLSFDDESMGGANNKVYTVQWKTLGEVARLKNGRDWKSLPSGEVPVYGSGGEMGEFVSDYAYDKPTVLIPRKGLISNLFYLDKPFWNVDTIYYTEIDDSQMMPRYFYHYLTTVDLERLSTNPTRPSLTQAILDKIEIPLPSLAIQSRIVQVLDNFDTVCNDLNIGLPKEIELRQKQYEFFRDKLLTFTAEGVYTDSTVQYRQDLIRLLQWVFGPIRVSLGAICDFTRGNGLQKKDFIDEGYPVIHYGQIYTRYGFSTKDTISFTSQTVFDKLKKAKPNDIVMATTSENVEDVGKAVVWEGTEEIGVSGDAYIVQTSQNARYLNYFFKSVPFQSQKEKKVTGTKVIRINAKDMENFLIPLPDLEQQQQIVNILDKFDTLTSDLIQGLPKEIELRRKQYEYFRDKLLQF